MIRNDAEAARKVAGEIVKKARSALPYVTGTPIGKDILVRYEMIKEIRSAAQAGDLANAKTRIQLLAGMQPTIRELLQRQFPTATRAGSETR